ncbi:MAG TPA: hypothetical protein DGG95_17675 [Cytophagales bacterium]|jgi:hypothetical protein|nr:hypothetical protein [Cytophagales bacterium]
MKLTRYILIASFSIVCCSNSKKANESEVTQNELFSVFIKNFDSLQLPLSIIRDGLFKYGSPVFYDSVRRNPGNPYYNVVETKYHRFLQKKIERPNKYKYRYLLASKLGNLSVILYKQIDLEAESFSIKMSTLTYDGGVIDTLTLAGMKANVSEKYVEIDKDWKIHTTYYHYLPDELPIQALVANKEEEEFIITNDGHFKKTFSNKKKGYFDIGPGNKSLVPYKK